MALTLIPSNMFDNYPTAGAPDAVVKGTSDPLVNTNPATGVGSVYMNKTSGEMWVCTDATTDANVWMNVGKGTGDIVPNAFPTNVTNTGNFPASHIENSSYTFTFSGGTDSDGSVTHYKVESISSDKLTVATAEVAAGQAHTFNTGAVDADVTGITFVVKSKDNEGLYSSPGITVTTSVLNNVVPTNATNTGSFPASHADNSSYTFTFSGATDADGSVTHYLVDTISSDKLTVATAEVAAGSAHTFNTGDVDADVTGITFRVRAKDNGGDYSSGVTVTTAITNVIYTTATGGNVTTSGNYKIHTFTTSGTFEVTQVGDDDVLDYLVVAGGGGGGHGMGGGGGAGGLRNSYASETSGGGGSSESSLTASVQSYPVTVGGGGASVSTGSNSVFLNITSTGGGYGGSYDNGSGTNGGCGGGGNGSGSPGTGTANQGYRGGLAAVGSSNRSAGGGGAGAVGGQNQGNSSPAGAGGVGVQSNIDGNNYYWAGGGGGANYEAGGGDGGLGGGGGGSQRTTPGSAGTGGGSALNTGQSGSISPNSAGGAGGENTGGGGGGGSHGDPGGAGGAGGKGVVIIRYKFQN